MSRHQFRVHAVLVVPLPGGLNFWCTFLRHAEAAARQRGLDTRALIVEVGQRNAIGGQEAMITDIALDLAAADSAK